MNCVKKNVRNMLHRKKQRAPNNKLLLIEECRLYKLIILFFLFVSSNLFADELYDRAKLKEQVKTLYLTSEFSELNRLVSDFLETSQRTSSGIWKLTLVYDALYSIPDSSISTPEYWDDIKAKADKWINVEPSSSVANLFYARLLVDEAWSIRGNGWGNEVTPEKFKLFREKIGESRALLESKNHIKLQDPQWYADMLLIALAEGWSESEFYKLLDEALEKYPTFYEIHFTAIEYLQPKWHGSTEALEKFAKYSVSKSSDLEGNTIFARIYWAAFTSQFGSELITKNQMNWDLMKAGIEDLISDYPSPWNAHNFARYACMKGDKETTRFLMDIIQDDYSEAAWKSSRYYLSCKNWALN